MAGINYRYRRNRRYRRYRKTALGMKRNLKKSNIFSNKSAKSQAKQIYYLNKKVTKLSKQSAPEIDTLADNLLFASNLQDNQPLKEYNGRIVLFRDYITNADWYTNHTGFSLEDDCDTVKVRSLQIFGSFAFTDENRLSAPWATNPNYTLDAGGPRTAYMKLIVCKTKAGGSGFPNRLTVPLNEENPTTTAYADMSLINGPLVKNLSKRLEILRIKVIKITDSNPQKMFKIKLPGFTYKKVVGENPFNSNEIIIYYQYCCPTMLQHANTSTGAITKISPSTHFQLNYKIAWNRNPGIQIEDNE